MLGVEVVQSTESKKPAPAAAAHIKEAMLMHRVLMTVDGPHANVLKLKPPMVFAEPDADRMLAVLKQVQGPTFLLYHYAGKDPAVMSIAWSSLQLGSCVTREAKEKPEHCKMCAYVYPLL